MNNDEPDTTPSPNITPNHHSRSPRRSRLPIEHADRPEGHHHRHHHHHSSYSNHERREGASYRGQARDHGRSELQCRSATRILCTRLAWSDEAELPIDSQVRFEKRCIFDPELPHDHPPAMAAGPKAPPKYLTAADLAAATAATASIPPTSSGGLRDPRRPTRRLEPPRLRPANLQIDDNWTGPLPSSRLVMAGIPKTIANPVQLVAFLEHICSPDITDAIVDSRLGPFDGHDRPGGGGSGNAGFASIAFVDGLVASQAASQLGNQPSLAIWRDSDGRRYERLMRETRRLAEREPPDRSSKRPKQWPDDRYHRPAGQAATASRQPSRQLRCNPAVPCLTIDYRNLPADRASRDDLARVFDRFDLGNVERGADAWHIHFGSEEECQRVLAEAKERPFDLDGRRRLHLCIVPRKGGILEAAKNGAAQPAPPPQDTHAQTAILDRLYGAPAEMPAGMEHAIPSGDLPSSPVGAHRKDNAAIATGQSDLASDIMRLPSFNRRLLDRKDRKKGRQQHQPEPSPSQDRGGDGGGGETGPASQPADHPKPVESRTGCARTDGYYKLAPESKRLRRTANGGAEAAGPTIDYHHHHHHHHQQQQQQQHRISRAENRRIVGQLEGNLRGALGRDISLRFSAFQSRRKRRLLLLPSAIHAFGLFTEEDIEAGEMVIEYVGELVRYSVANVREARYERDSQGGGGGIASSSYLFRLDDLWVVDATHRGNLARFTNHSCEPNCHAKVLLVDGNRRIVMYARRAIAAGDEITYDYKFPAEPDPRRKIACLCRAATCRKFLN